mmetsp:Transcript_61717/g.193444  ORF Transcript_61717/g.193444 Transcript_61717/m.193444 type:complete len:246 (+) Transcript_61717:522-1259(+)
MPSSVSARRTPWSSPGLTLLPKTTASNFTRSAAASSSASYGSSPARTGAWTPAPQVALHKGTPGSEQSQPTIPSCRGPVPCICPVRSQSPGCWPIADLSNRTSLRVPSTSMYDCAATSALPVKHHTLDPGPKARAASTAQSPSPQPAKRTVALGLPRRWPSSAANTMTCGAMAIVVAVFPVSKAPAMKGSRLTYLTRRYASSRNLKKGNMPGVWATVRDTAALTLSTTESLTNPGGSASLSTDAQ